MSKDKPSNLVEVCGSFSYKHNSGSYESRDFFCSQKAECAAEEVEVTYERIHDFCREPCHEFVHSRKNIDREYIG